MLRLCGTVRHVRPSVGKLNLSIINPNGFSHKPNVNVMSPQMVEKGSLRFYSTSSISNLGKYRSTPLTVDAFKQKVLNQDWSRRGGVQWRSFSSKKDAKKDSEEDAEPPIVIEEPMGVMDLPIPDKIFLVPLYRRPFFPGIQQVTMTTDFGKKLQDWKQDDNGFIGLFLAKNPTAKDEELTSSDTTSFEDDYLGTEADEGQKVFKGSGYVPETFDIGVLGLANQVDVHEKNTLSELSGYYRIQIEEVLEKSEKGTLVRVKRLYDKPHSKDNRTIRASNAEIISTINELKLFMNETENRAISNRLLALSEDPSKLADFGGSLCRNADTALLQEALECLDVDKRQGLVLSLLKGEVKWHQTRNNIFEKINENTRKHHNRMIMQEQLKMIRKQLGYDRDERKTIIEKFKERLKDKVVPENIQKTIDDEMRRLEQLEPSSSEFNVLRNYLDWLTILPWGTHTADNLDVIRAEKILNEDHYGLKDVKERILEFIAVGKLKSIVQGKILCFIGPPGVGKTSIGKSIARALDRKFFRFSVGGMSDVAEIKGHRRTYIGAMPGKIIQCLKSVESSNPVILIDEVDKIGRGGYQGDPSSALLEVLDPGQNGTFLDHYLDVPVDLSQVLFVCTANTRDTIPAPLLDRMEVLNLSGYVLQEKQHIAQQHLIPSARKASGLTKGQAQLSPGAVRALIKDYCREAGVRNLQKQTEKIFRKIAYQIVTSKKSVVAITESNLSQYVGKPVFNSDKYYDDTPVGVVMGLAYTQMGGSTLYVETVVDKLSGKPELRTTGQLGDVMKESSSIAYTFAQSFVQEVSLGNRFFDSATLHMHVPEGATPKDGPSAGCTMVTSLISLALDKPVRRNVAMTGEVTLTGKVLPVGGIKEKIIAAGRSGVKDVIVPAENQKDVEELESYIKKGLRFHFADYYQDVFDVAFSSTTKKVATAKKTAAKKSPAVKKKAERVASSL